MRCPDQIDRPRILFMGSPDFAVPTLKCLNERYDILAVFTQPPRKSGRGMQQKKTPIGHCAQALGLECFWPESLKSDEAISHLTSFRADLFVVIAYGLILPQAVLDLPQKGCINGHASLLPRWRGAAPIQRAIEAGDTKTGITIMQMEAGLDTGPMLAKAELAITQDMNAGILHDKLAEMTASLMPDTIDQLMAGAAKAEIQPENGVSYAQKITPQDLQLRLDQPAQQLIQKIRAFSPAPGSFINSLSGRLKLLTAQLASPVLQDVEPGTFLGHTKSGILVACADNQAIEITCLQPAGKQAMSGAAFLNGHSWQTGQNILAE